MADTLCGFMLVERECLDCGKTYNCNFYDSGAFYCPECRVKRYRKNGSSMVIND